MSDSDNDSVWDLRGISTQWSVVADANIFVLRYVNAIQHYLQRLLKNEDDVEEVLQQFLVKVLENGFQTASPDRGRFRFYLIRSIRNEVITWHRARARQESVSLGALTEPAESTESNDDWDHEWQACVLDRSWKHLRQHESENAGNLCYSVLHATTNNTGANSEELASLVTTQTGHELSAPAFRKQLSRARRMFAECIVREVRETLDSPTPESVKNELADLKLMSYVESHLPDSWQ